MAKTREPQISKNLARHARRVESSIEREILDFLADALASDEKYISDAATRRSQANVAKAISSFGAYARKWEDEELSAFYERQIAEADREMK
jgi:hypothetical protein